jgi:hypothetical protein
MFSSRNEKKLVDLKLAFVSSIDRVPEETHEPPGRPYHASLIRVQLTSKLKLISPVPKLRPSNFDPYPSGNSDLNRSRIAYNLAISLLTIVKLIDF